MKLMTQRLVLRDYKPEDWEQVHTYGSDADFCKYEEWGPNTVEETKRFIEDSITEALRNPRFDFECAVCLKDTNILIGGCGFRRAAPFRVTASIGWAIAPLFQNHGYATEAARGLIQFGFEQIKLKLIYATCDDRNVASYRVMEKPGMRNAGLIKGIKEVKGHVRQTLRYELSHEDHRALPTDSS